MEIKAKLKYLRIAPRKVRLLADLIRGKTTEEAQNILEFSIQKSALPLLKLLKSALANAKNNSGLEGANFYISKITVDEVPKLKRWRARSRGQAFGIQKKTSHITLILSETEEKTKKVKKTKKTKAKKSEPKKVEKKEEVEKKERPRFRPEKEFQKPGAGKLTKKIFRRKAF
jgi:large subunit ribosomal protein L22